MPGSTRPDRLQQSDQGRQPHQPSSQCRYDIDVDDEVLKGGWRLLDEGITQCTKGAAEGAKARASRSAKPRNPAVATMPATAPVTRDHSCGCGFSEGSISCVRSGCISWMGSIFIYLSGAPKASRLNVATL